MPALPRIPAALALAWGVYAVLMGLTITQVGVVGEVAIGWGLGMPPDALLSVEPMLWADGARSPTAGHRLGPLVASQVRPIETLWAGPLALPLAINAYTGGPPDWPARLVWLATGSLWAVGLLHALLGAVLMGLVHRFLRFHASTLAAGLAALLLGTEWCFVFYRKVLGGTELLLMAAGLLCLWAIWSRRWAGGRHGLTALGIGIGLGLLAKITFGITLLALAGTTLLTRWDKPRLGPPLPDGLWRPVVAVGLLTAPLWGTFLHHSLGVPLEGHIRSHDFPDLQLKRVFDALSGGPSPSREGLANLIYWALDAPGFFSAAYDAQPSTGAQPLRVVGWVFLAAGVGFGWIRRLPGRREALLRFTSLFLLLQIGLLLLIARDVHHLAQASPTLAIVGALAAERLAALHGQPKSWARARWALAMALPAMAGGIAQLWALGPSLDSIQTPTFTEQGQRALVAALDQAGVERLVVADYESYGMLELRAPHIQTTHLWPLVRHEGPGALGPVINHATGGHLLLVDASAPMVYNLRAREAQIEEAAAAQGRTAVRVFGEAKGPIRLFKVD